MQEEAEELEQSEEEVQQTEAEAAEQEAYDKVFYDDSGAEEEPAPEPEEEEPTPEEEPEPEVEEEEPEPEEEPEEQPEEEPDPEKEEEAPKLVTLKWRGKEIQATQEEVIAMAQQNFDATHKYQEVSDLRKSTKADLDLLEAARGGDQKAIAQIMKSAEIDPVDLLDMDIEQENLEQGTPDQDEPFISPRVSEMIEEVSQDPELLNNLQEIERELPQTVIDKMAKDPETFYSIVNEVRSGDAAIVMPQVQKEIAKLNGLDKSVVMGDIDAFANLYINVKNSMIQAAQPEQPETKTQKQKRNTNELTIKKSGGTQRKGSKAVDSFTDDKAYQAILDRLES